jgi:hypothetical protein
MLVVIKSTRLNAVGGDRSPKKVVRARVEDELFFVLGLAGLLAASVRICLTRAGSLSALCCECACACEPVEVLWRDDLRLSPPGADALPLPSECARDTLWLFPDAECDECVLSPCPCEEPRDCCRDVPIPEYTACTRCADNLLSSL